MEFLRLLLLFSHLIGLSLLLGGFAVALRADKKIIPIMLRGAEIQLVTGLLLIGVREADDLPVDHAKTGIKLLIAIAVLACAFISRRRNSRELFYATGTLALINTAVAVFWT